MRKLAYGIVAGSLFSALILGITAHADAPAPGGAVRTGSSAFGDWTTDAPGVRRLIAAADLPMPGATKPASNASAVVNRPANAVPKVPAGFTVEQFAQGLKGPRAIRIAPNGDIFVAESNAGNIRVMRAADGAAKPTENAVFASGLNYPYGIAFYPAGPNPEYVYIGNNDSVVRYPYHNGDMEAHGAPETIVARLPPGGHATRDLRVAPDGKHILIAVGSQSNVAEGMNHPSTDDIRTFEAQHGVGASWGMETTRADVLMVNPDGSGGLQSYANGIRNCAGLAIQPATNEVWCATNERDLLGDNLPPDYVTHVRQGGFYGWPWYYIGAHEDPRHKGERPDLADKVTVPDVLLQPHSAPLQIAFYDGKQFPAEYSGDAFVTLHGSWNRADRTGYKVVRLILKDGKATGAYEDFLTGFVVDRDNVWARPVGVAVAHDGSLLVGEDGNGTMWRITYTGGK